MQLKKKKERLEMLRNISTVIIVVGIALAILFTPAAPTGSDAKVKKNKKFDPQWSSTQK